MKELTNEEIKTLTPIWLERDKRLREYLNIDNKIFEEGNGFRLDLLAEREVKKQKWQESENLVNGLLLHYLNK